MFRCQICGRVVPAGTRAHRLVVRTRTVRYPFRADVNRVVKLVNGKRKVTRTDDPGGTGSAILTERLACPQCANGQALG